MRIKNSAEYTYEIEKSRFIAYLFRCFSVDEAKERLEQIRKLHPDATHVCHAYKIGNTIAHSSDDNEPSGTAGIPIKEVLDKNNLTDVIAIVVRYFGGIKLGAGGLIRAYGTSVSLALKETEIVSPKIKHVYSLSLDYSLFNKIDQKIRQYYTVLSVDYSLDVTITFYTDNDPFKTVNQLTSGKYNAVYLKDEEIEE